MCGDIEVLVLWLDLQIVKCTRCGVVYFGGNLGHIQVSAVIPGPRHLRRGPIYPACPNSNSNSVSLGETSVGLAETLSGQTPQVPSN